MQMMAITCSNGYERVGICCLNGCCCPAEGEVLIGMDG